jgi:Glycosyl hydrolase family 20, catalytic domain
MQANLWTECVADPATAEYMLLPRLSAIAECLWSPLEARAWAPFERRAALMLARSCSDSSRSHLIPLSFSARDARMGAIREPPARIQAQQLPDEPLSDVSIGCCLLLYAPLACSIRH